MILEIKLEKKSYKLEVEFLYNQLCVSELRDIVTCVVFYQRTPAGTASAIRNPQDKQDVKIGERLALKRACLLFWALFVMDCDWHTFWSGVRFAVRELGQEASREN